MEERTTFGTLPAELRTQVWKHAIREPQIVEVYCDTRSGYAQSPVRPPVILFVCRESRHIAENHFSLLCAYSAHLGACPIYILLNLDTVYFSLREMEGLKRDYRYFSTLFRQVNRGVARDLKKITIDLGGCLDADIGRRGLQRFLPMDAFLCFRSLKRLDVVAGKKTALEGTGENLELVRLHQYEEESAISDSDSDSDDGNVYTCECCRLEHHMFFYPRTRSVLQKYMRDLQKVDSKWTCPQVEGVVLRRKEEDKDKDRTLFPP